MNPVAEWQERPAEVSTGTYFWFSPASAIVFSSEETETVKEAFPQPRSLPLRPLQSSSSWGFHWILFLRG
jgi:hypothetical protein